MVNQIFANRIASSRTNVIASLIGLSLFAWTAHVAEASTIWSGDPITFTKAPFTSHLLPQNQDFFTPNVIITRASTKGIFNIAINSAFVGMGASSPSPVGTEWAFGTLANTPDPSSLPFGTWGSVHGGGPPPGGPASLIGQDLVVHLVEDDVFLDLRFTQWGGAGSGSFAYLRSTPPPLEPVPGDRDGDRLVTLVDLVITLDDLGGAFDRIDAAVVVHHLGVDESAASIGAVTAVPEPSTLGLLSLGALAFMRRHRKS